MQLFIPTFKFSQFYKNICIYYEQGTLLDIV